MMTESTNWREIFSVDDRVTFKTEKKCTCGNGNCRTAKRIRCTCRCHAVAHGIETRQGMQPLETFSESDPVAETFNVEEYEQELAILA